ncbi:hypothetical protein BHM03_00003178 [Ensete ventricosum]|nr:hypothetical protein BHM03_00003178 [Ensete ventricosum]
MALSDLNLVLICSIFTYVIVLIYLASQKRLQRSRSFKTKIPSSARMVLPVAWQNNLGDLHISDPYLAKVRNVIYSSVGIPQSGNNLGKAFYS